MPVPPNGTTITLPPPAQEAATVTRAATVASGFDVELRQLLRSRLILVHLLALLFVAALQVLSWAAPANDPLYRPDQGNPWLLIPAFAECLVGAVVLWRLPGMSLRTLRVWELIHFTTVAAFYGRLRYVMLAYTAWLAPDPDMTIGFYGLATAFSFTTIILSYGVLVPNTFRRSLAGVTAIATVPFVSVAVAASTKPELRDAHVVPLLVQTAAHLAFPAAIAVFAANRAAALQRRAYDAEKRANEIGQYTLQKKLGAGGMGEVWLAEHRLLKRPCAVKFIRAELAANSATAARFAREVRVVITLSHFNTIRIYDYGQADDGSFYYVMEYLDGPTLESLIARAGPLAPGRAVYLLRQLCGALAEAHAAGLVHRDLKPGNVIVAALGGQHDVAKLLDFGLVQDLSTADGSERLTQAGVVMGTPAYMCPEQAGGSSSVDARGDVYSLGAVAFFMLTGRLPFECVTVGEYLTAHLTKSAPLVSTLRAEVSVDLTAVVAKCLAKDPKARFQTATELEAALAACTCAGEWSAGEAAKWWARGTPAPTVNLSAPTATFHKPEPTPT